VGGVLLENQYRTRSKPTVMQAPTNAECKPLETQGRCSYDSVLDGPGSHDSMVTQIESEMAAQEVRQPSRPVLQRKPSALWSQPTASESQPSLPTPTLGWVLLACVLAEMAMDGESLLSSRSGMLVMFGKSLHSINHYWFRTRYISRTVVGCFVLKFIGSTLISLVLLGRPPSWYSEQHHVISFLLAFCMVRSDALEAKELSGHMRYAAPATIALNFVAALQKMRSLVSLVEKRHEVGRVAVLGFGTLAFSACNALMVAEAYCLRRAATRPAASEVEVRTPCMRTTLCRHAFALALLLAAQPAGSRLGYALAKCAVLGMLFRAYNDGLLMHEATPTTPAQAPAQAPAPATAQATAPATASPLPAAPLLASPPRQLLLQALAIAPTVRRPQQRHERHERPTSSPMSAWRYNWLAVRATALSLMGLATALRPELHEGSMAATGPAHATVRPKDAAGTRNGASSLGTSLLAPRGGGEAMRRGADGAPVLKDHEGLGLHCRSSLLQPRPRQPTVAE